MRIDPVVRREAAESTRPADPGLPADARELTGADALAFARSWFSEFDRRVANQRIVDGRAGHGGDGNGGAQ